LIDSFIDSLIDYLFVVRQNSDSNY